MTYKIVEIKLNGEPEALEIVNKKLGETFNVIKTSQVIENNRDNLYHQFITVILEFE